MRMFIVPLLLALLPVPSQAESPALPAGFVSWDAARIEQAADRLEKELGDKKMVFATIGNYPGHSMYLVLRGRTGDAEFHETESDFQIGWRGKASFVIGGELVDRETQPRKQQRGSAIKGGKSMPFGRGDIIHVPPAIPHQIIVTPGQPFMYLLIKLDEEPLTRQ